MRRYVDLNKVFEVHARVKWLHECDMLDTRSDS